jgi:ABC-2 type transport system ATP-binding protein
MKTENIIEIEDLKINRGDFLLDISHLSVKPGQVVGLVGPNGAGKTTLLEAIAGLCSRDGGQVNVLGNDPWKHPSVRQELGFMSDEMPVFDMKIGPLLKMISGYYPNWDPTLADELLEKFKIATEMRSNKLSRGEGTRLRLLLAMAFKPRVLILDEPAGGLDLAGRHALLESVLEVVRDPGRSVIISSHLLGDVERISDRILVLNKGRLIRDGGTEELLGDETTLEEALISWGAAG